jgi:hypothetical protein
MITFPFRSQARPWIFRAALAFLLLLLGALGSLPAAHAATLLPVETLLNPDGSLNTRTGVSGPLDLRGWHVTLDSMRGPLLTRTASTLVAPLDTWSALANSGLNDPVWSMAVIGTDLYVGGDFSQTADGAVTNLNRIARLSATTPVVVVPTAPVPTTPHPARPAEVTEADTLLLMAGGLGGLAIWLRGQWTRRRPRG